MGRLPSKLLELLKDEYKLQTGARAEVQSLSRELESMHAALRRVALAPPELVNELVRLWARDAREQSYDMEDVLDTFLVRVDGSKLFSLSKVKARREIACAIAGIKTQLREMTERRDRYKVDDLVPIPAAAVSVDPRLSALYTKVSQLVGIDEQRDALIEMLSVGEDDGSDKAMKIVSVVGFGGLGKTTLAKVVYDKLNSQFDCCAFVPVGRNPDPRKVLRDILIDLSDNGTTNSIIDLSDNGTTNSIIDHANKRYAGRDMMGLDERQLINKLREFLEGKRYFIVVDDIWMTSTWALMHNAFVDSNRGSRIIATTRNSQVSMEIGKVYRMKELSDNNSKKLFYTRIVGGEEKHPSNDDELAEVSDPIIEKCGGVPLAIIAIASLLATKPIKDWPSVYNSIGLGHEDDTQVKDMMNILSFSYYDLPCYLRTCLLYLSIYPEDYAIEKRSLIWRWIAEGLVHEENGKGFFEVGDSYFHELINRNMVIPIEGKGSDILYGCRVHDMVLHLIRDLSSEENFVVVLDSEPWSFAQGNVRRLAIQMLNDETTKKASNLSIEHMPQVRSFNAVLCLTNMIPSVGNFKVLRVLVLEFCFGKEGYDLKHIANLLHLRYIGLSHILNARKLPKNIGCLKFLQTLLLNNTRIQELPASMHLLTQLMCLRVDQKMRAPDWIGDLTSLVELEIYHEVPLALVELEIYHEVPDWIKEQTSLVEPEMYHGGAHKRHSFFRKNHNMCSTGRFVKELGKLRNLRVLKTGMNLQDEGQGRDLLESLSNLHKIQRISISFAKAFLEMNVVMEPSFALSSSLHALELQNIEFPRLPAWINAHDLPNLYKLKVLVSHAEEKDMVILGMFRELSELRLFIIRKHRLKLPVCGCGGFQNLRSMDLMIPLQFLEGAMPRLEHINFRVPVVELKDANIGFNFGLGNLSSLRSMRASIDCVDACPMEVEEVEAALWHAVGTHPNHPTHDTPRMNEDKMGPADASSRKMNRHMYKILLAMSLDESTNQCSTRSL